MLLLATRAMFKHVLSHYLNISPGIVVRAELKRADVFGLLVIVRQHLLRILDALAQAILK